MCGYFIDKVTDILLNGPTRHMLLTLIDTERPQKDAKQPKRDTRRLRETHDDQKERETTTKKKRPQRRTMDTHRWNMRDQKRFTQVIIYAFTHTFMMDRCNLAWQSPPCKVTPVHQDQVLCLLIGGCSALTVVTEPGCKTNKRQKNWAKRLQSDEKQHKKTQKRPKKVLKRRWDAKWLQRHPKWFVKYCFFFCFIGRGVALYIPQWVKEDKIRLSMYIIPTCVCRLPLTTHLTNLIQGLPTNLNLHIVSPVAAPVSVLYWVCCRLYCNVCTVHTKGLFTRSTHSDVLSGSHWVSAAAPFSSEEELCDWNREYESTNKTIWEHFNKALAARMISQRVSSSGSRDPSGALKFCSG